MTKTLTILLFTVIPSLAHSEPTPARFGLSDLYKSTVGGSELVRTREEERSQILETKNQGVGAILPQINGVGTYYKADLPNTSGANAFSNSTTQKVLKLTGKQYLFKGGTEYSFIARTNRLLEAKEAELDGSRQRYFLDLSDAYYDMLLRQAELTHARTELALYDEQISELRSRVKIGRTRSSELLSVQAARAGSEAQLKSTESTLLSSKNRLANLARIAPDFVLTEEVPDNTNLASLDEYLKLSSQRPDLAAARKLRDAAAEDISFQRGGHFPTLDLSGNYYLKREGLGSSNNSKWDALLTLTLPIFSGGTTQASVRQSANILKVNEIETGRLERTAESEIRTLYQNLIASEAELKSFSEAVELAKKSYDQTRKDYRFGLTSNLDLLNSLKTLTAAKRNLDQAKYKHFLERIQIEIGSGRIPTLHSARN